MRFLRLFAIFRQMEQDATYWRQRAELFEKQAETERKEARFALMMVADWQAMINGQAPIYGVGRVPVDKPVQEPEVAQKRLAAEAVRDLERQFEREYEERLKSWGQ